MTASCLAGLLLAAGSPSAGVIFGIAGVVVGIGGILAGALFARTHRKDIQRARKDIEDARRNIAKARSHIRKLRRQTLSALGLHEVLVKDRELETGVRKIADQYARITLEDDSEPLLLDLAHRKLYDAAQFMNMASEAHVIWGSDTFASVEQLASTLLEHTKKDDEFWASSFVDNEFWARATAYLKQQEEKKRQGVNIKRVFIFTDANPLDDEAKAHMDAQCQAGIEVTHIADPTFQPRDLVVVLRKIAGELAPIYAMECRFGDGKRIDHVELWVDRGLQATAVAQKWWSLHGIFTVAPAPTPAKHLKTDQGDTEPDESAKLPPASSAQAPEQF